MSILQLKNAGEEMILDVVTAKKVEGKFGMQVQFDTKDGDTLYVPLSSVERQLVRAGVSEVGELSGRVLHFSRAENKKGGAPFWNIDPASVAHAMQSQERNGKPPIASALPANKPKTVPGGEDDAEYADRLAAQDSEYPPMGYSPSFSDLVEKYRQCSEAAQNIWGTDVDGQAIVAATATLFIERNRRNV